MFSRTDSIENNFNNIIISFFFFFFVITKFYYNITVVRTRVGGGGAGLSLLYGTLDSNGNIVLQDKSEVAMKGSSVLTAMEFARLGVTRGEGRNPSFNCWYVEIFLMCYILSIHNKLLLVNIFFSVG